MFLYFSMVRSSYITILSGMGDDVPILGALVTHFNAMGNCCFYTSVWLDHHISWFYPVWEMTSQFWGLWWHILMQWVTVVFVDVSILQYANIVILSSDYLVNMVILSIWSSGRLVIWWTGHLVIWSSGHMVVWSIWLSVPLVIWSSGHMVIWSIRSSNHLVNVVIWGYGHMVNMVIWSAGHLVIWSSCQYGSLIIWLSGHLAIWWFGQNGHLVNVVI